MRSEILFFDFETYPNYLLICYSLRGNSGYIEFTSMKDVQKMVDLFNSVEYICGVNILNYDIPLAEGIYKLFTKYESYSFEAVLGLVYRLSSNIIDANRIYIKSKLKDKAIDLQEVSRANQQRVSLEKAGFILEANDIQSLPYNPTFKLTRKQKDKVREYCFNDIDKTILKYDYLSNRIQLRIDFAKIFNEKYNANLNLISKSDTGIAKDVFRHFLGNIRSPRREFRLKLDEIIFDYIVFEHPALQVYLELLKDKVIDSKWKKLPKSKRDKLMVLPNITFDNILYVIGIGGIHSEDPARRIIRKEGWRLCEIDEASMYPFEIIYNELYPLHIDKDKWLDLAANTLVYPRIDYKKKYKETKDEYYNILQYGLKIVINSGLFGLLNDLYSFTYCFETFLKVTINNQLRILMLIERLHKIGVHTLSANTDGVLVHYPMDKDDEVQKVVNRWKKDVKSYDMEFTDYEQFIQLNVNSYLAIGKDYKFIKSKKDFERKEDNKIGTRLNKAYKNNIIAILLHEYYMNNKLPEEEIYNQKNPHDFCSYVKDSAKTKYYLAEDKFSYQFLSNKTNKAYKSPKLIYHKGKQYKADKFTRFFISTYHDKAKMLVGKATNEGYYIKDQYVTECNNMKNFNFDLVNYQYYIDEVYKIINKIENEN